MRIERGHAAALGALGVMLCFVAGCPGTLADKASFFGLAGASGTSGSSGNGNGGEAAGPVGGGPEAGPGGCADIIDRVFAPSCGDTGCHGAVGSQMGLDLVSPDLASRVVGVSGKGCASVLADPQNPEQSLLYTKLKPQQTCGAQMPLARPPLSDEDAACVLAWIAAQ